MATIKAIEGRTVHQIQSGQVIVDLCSVVKELVENSLDAGATSVEVRFKNQGLDAIEVQDNGDGISAANYDTLALKHHTSKLSTYDDLTTLQTFGFRGEALSSLCALSNFSVITCMAQDAPKGTKLEFEVSGKLKGTSVVAAQKGTTVVVENLFNNLPVRRRALEKNIKTAWGKVVSHLNQYACIQTGIKFTVTQQAGKGKKTTIFSTKGNATTRENIVNVFGAKTLTALIAMDLKLELEPTSGPSQRWNTQDDGVKKEIRIVGHISRPASGEGRQTPDRQMFFVNSRPCGLPQVSKAFNEVYKGYNGFQSPFIFANIELDTHLYDVNVSPDKRTIMLHDQHRMLENLKEALTALFESQDYTVPISQLPAQKQPSYKQLTISRDRTTPSKTPQSETPKVPVTPAEPETGEELVIDSRGSRREESADSEVSRKTFNPAHRRTSVSQEARTRVISRKSMSKDGASVSLISNWVERETEERSEEPEKKNKPSRAPTEGLSKEKVKLISKLTKQDQVEQNRNASDDDAESPVSEAHSPSLFVPESREPSVIRERSASFVEESPEPPIPSLQSPPKPTQSIADRFSSTARSFRAPAEIATITIGNHTVTSSIGTPCPKRSKPNSFPNTSRSNAQSKVPAAKLPSFGSVLSQRFAAAGAAPNNDSVEDDIEDDEPTQSRSSFPDTADSLPEDIGPSSFYGDGEVNQYKSYLETKPGEDDIYTASPVEGADTFDSEYLDETEKKAIEDVKVQEMIKEAENSAVAPTQEHELRTKGLLKGGARKKESTVNLLRKLETTAAAVEKQFRTLESRMASYQAGPIVKSEDDGLESTNAEAKLSLTISKTDFAKMKIVGQFNLGFILASRTSDPDVSTAVGDDLFIIDQHASDEKYNFERLQATTIVQSQPLVQPKVLDLTAMEEEIVMENLPALATNGFIVTVDNTGESPVGHRCSLVALPLSKDTAFSLTDLEELIALLAEPGVLAGSVPRPSKVRKMFAMRACRSSVMIGKTLTSNQMGVLVSHLGELDKPWNCPHGRPTMRHLCGLGGWDEAGWREGNGWDGEEEEGMDLSMGYGGDDITEWKGRMDLAAWVRDKKVEVEDEVEEDGDDEEMLDGADESLFVEDTAEDEMNETMYEAYSSALGQPVAEEGFKEEDNGDDDEDDGEESTESEASEEEL